MKDSFTYFFLAHSETNFKLSAPIYWIHAYSYRAYMKIGLSSDLLKRPEVHHRG